MKQCPPNSEIKSYLFWNLSADKHKTRYFHIGQGSKFLFLTSFRRKLIENEVQEMGSNRREEKGKSKDLRFVGDLSSSQSRL